MAVYLHERNLGFHENGGGQRCVTACRLLISALHFLLKPGVPFKGVLVSLKWELQYTITGVLGIGEKSYRKKISSLINFFSSN